MNAIETNIAARKDAEEIIAFIGDKPARFWELMAAHAATKLPQKSVEPKDLPMDDDEAAKFEEWMIPWGKYAEHHVGEVPVGYLLFLAEGDEFTRKLRRYVASKMFARRQDEEENYASQDHRQ